MHVPHRRGAVEHSRRVLIAAAFLSVVSSPSLVRAQINVSLSYCAPDLGHGCDGQTPSNCPELLTTLHLANQRLQAALSLEIELADFADQRGLRL